MLLLDHGTFTPHVANTQLYPQLIDMNGCSTTYRRFNVAGRNVEHRRRLPFHTFYYWSEEMKQLAIVFAVGAAALLGNSAADAADNMVKAKAAIDSTQQSTDLSSRDRRYRNYRHYGHRSYR